MSPAPKKAPEALDPLATHAELLHELEHVAALRDDLLQEAAELRSREMPPPYARLAIGQLAPQLTQAAIDAARVDVVRGKSGADAEVARLTEQRAAVEATIRELREREAALNRAEAAVLADIEQLVEEHFPAFTAEGVRLAEEAHGALADLAADDRLQRAEDAWQAAASYWSRLPRSHNAIHSRPYASHLGEVPPSPLAGIADLSTRALPPEVIAAVEAGDDPGATVRFVQVDKAGAPTGEGVEVPAGSREALQLDRNTNYRRV